MFIRFAIFLFWFGSGILLQVPLAVAADARISAGGDERWIATWMASQQLVEPGNRPPAPGLSQTTLRQIVRISIGGEKFRLMFSNVFGRGPLAIEDSHVAIAASADAIAPNSDRGIRFSGRSSVVLPAGTSMLSDPVDLPVAALTRLAISLRIASAPEDLTGHPGSRTTSFVSAKSSADAVRLESSVAVDHWYFLAGIETQSAQPSSAVVVLGDSITDGRGSTTNAQNRWPDVLAERLKRDARTAGVAVLNAGIGGNRLLHDGLGPSALSRFDRDVLAPPGVRWLIVLEGINDIGERHDARPRGQPYASAAEMIAAYEQIVARAHAHNIRVLGGTITPYAGADFYFTADGEAERQTVNRWIRTSGWFDAVIDFDAAVRDPVDSARLAREYDCGDHLHPSVAGYRRMAEAIDLAFFASPPVREDRQ